MVEEEEEDADIKLFISKLQINITWFKLLGGCGSSYWEDAEKAMAPHSSTLAWKIPWTEEPGRLQSMGSLRVGHD